MQDEAMARSTNRVRRDMQPGQAKWYVSTMGVPGEERVIAAAREEWFLEGRNPTMASIEQALVKKYGAVGKTYSSGGNAYLTWAYDPQGRRVAQTSPLYHQCQGTSDPDGGTNFSPDCGVVVVAQIFALRENPELSQYLQVGVIDQANGYAAITGTEQALQVYDAQRRAKEVEAASKNADAPKL
jgi:YD repeat-containing protein